MFSFIGLDISEAAEKLFHLLYTPEFDIDRLRKELESGMYDPDCVNAAAIEYVAECCGNRCESDYGDYPRRYGETVPGYENSHVTEAVELLLDYGLDPNRVYPELNSEGKTVDYSNIMDQLFFVNNGYQAADSLYLMLSHGGNPNLLLGSSPLILEPEWHVEFEIREREDIDDFAFDALIHYWLVLIGFGAGWGDGKQSVEPVGNFDISLLRNHRDYYYGIIHTKESHDGWQLCIFDRHMNLEVARF